MFCRQCGKQINDDALFCKFCGSETGLGMKTKKEEELQRLEEAKKAEQARITEEKRIAEERWKAEQAEKQRQQQIAGEKRKAEEAKKAEQLRIVKENKKADEAKKAEQARIAQEKRKAEESKKTKQKSEKAAKQRKEKNKKLCGICKEKIGQVPDKIKNDKSYRMKTIIIASVVLMLAVGIFALGGGFKLIIRGVDSNKYDKLHSTDSEIVKNYDFNNFQGEWIQVGEKQSYFSDIEYNDYEPANLIKLTDRGFFISGDAIVREDNYAINEVSELEVTQMKFEEIDGYLRIRVYDAQYDEIRIDYDGESNMLYVSYWKENGFYKGREVMTKVYERLGFGNFKVFLGVYYDEIVKDDYYYEWEYIGSKDSLDDTELTDKVDGGLFYIFASDSIKVFRYSQDGTVIANGSDTMSYRFYEGTAMVDDDDNYNSDVRKLKIDTQTGYLIETLWKNGKQIDYINIYLRRPDGTIEEIANEFN